MKTDIQFQTKTDSSIPFFSLRPGKECMQQSHGLDELLTEIRNGSKVRSETNRAFGEDPMLAFQHPSAASTPSSNFSTLPSAPSSL